MSAMRRIATRAALATCLVVVLDAVVARLLDVGLLTLETELRALSVMTLVLLPLALLTSTGLELLGLGPRAAGLTLLGLMLGCWADLVFLGFDQALEARRVVLESAPAGLAAGLALYLLGRRLDRDSQEPPERRLLGGVALLLMLLVVVAPQLLPGSAVRTPRAVNSGHAVPRVLLIVTDTLRADALGPARPGETSRTPHLDALASEGLSWSNARAPSGWTLPSMASLLTGVSPFVHGATERTSRLPDAVPTLAEAMARAGYRTAAIGQNAVLGPVRGLARGFDHYDFPVPELPATRSLGILAQALTRPNRKPVIRDAEDVNALAIAWLEEHGDEDFFLWLHYYDPHLEYGPPLAHQPAAQPPPGMRRAFGFEEFKRNRTGHEVLDGAQRDWVRTLYDHEVRYLDTMLGELFAYLKGRGLFEDTLIVFTSDHGEEFWEHEGMEHGHTLYDELLRVPLIVRLPAGPRGAAGTVAPIAAESSLENVPATVLTLCGIAFEPRDLSATSLVDAAGAPLASPGAPHASLGNLYYQDRAAVLWDGGRYKYVRTEVSGIEEVYDLRQDPEERSSLAGTRPELLEAGRARLAEVLAVERERRERLGVPADVQGIDDPAMLEALRGIGYAGEARDAEDEPR